MTHILSARGVRKSFGSTEVLRGIDLEIADGEFVTVMGPSGSGKSTLLYAVSGMDAPTAGTVVLDGVELTGLSHKALAETRLTTMGFVFQQVHLLKNLTLLDNIVLPAYLAKLASRTVLNDRALELMRRTGVEQLAEHDISQASGGQLQRVGICRALINRPRILFADEPTGALDVAAAADIMRILTELVTGGATVMVVTHDARVAAHSDRLVYVIDGRIVAELELGRMNSLDEVDNRHLRVIRWLEDRRAYAAPAAEDAPA